MPPQLATLIFAVGIAGLFWLNRDDSLRVSKLLWLPVIWLTINASRSVSAWLGMSPGMEIPGQLPQSSQLDQLIAFTLMLAGVIVLIRRRNRVIVLLKASWPIVLYFSFCLFSLIWSDFPAWGFKRWIRALGDVIMVLIVATDAQPAEALRHLFSRVGFVLLPASVLLIKYYPELGRGLDESEAVNTGVTTNKNSLGILALLISLGTLWQIIDLLRNKKQSNRSRRLLAQGALLYFGISLLFTAHSATSGASFATGAGLMLVLTLPLFRSRPSAVHALFLSLLLVGTFALLLGAKGEVVRAMGRKEDLTGRTEIWKIVLPMVPNSIGGAGFETFWLGPRMERINIMIGGISAANEAHNGYIEVYLNLGWLGLALIASIIVQGYGRTINAFRRDSALGALLLANVVAMALYNIGEAGFRMLNPAWFLLLLSILTASGAIRVGEKPRRSQAWNLPTVPGKLGCPRPQPDLGGSCSEVGL